MKVVIDLSSDFAPLLCNLTSLVGNDAHGSLGLYLRILVRCYSDS